MIEKRSYYNYYFFSSLPYYYYCFRRIFSVGTYTYLYYNMRLSYYYIIYRTNSVCGVVVVLLIIITIHVCVLYCCAYTVLPIPRNLSLLFFNTNRDFSFKVVKIIVKICWWPRQSCER